MSEIPDQLRIEVIAVLYRRADDLDWGGLGPRQKTAMYDQWLDDPKIGEVLTRYVPRERARLWLKDGAMKEYARARSGIGPYAEYVSSQLPGPEQIARQVLGESWQLVPATVQQKPNRCRVQDSSRERTMMWGPPASLRDLVWAGINAVADDSPLPLLVVTTVGGAKLTDGERRRHIDLGKIAGLDVVHTTLRLKRTNDL